MTAQRRMIAQRKRRAYLELAATAKQRAAPEMTKKAQWKGVIRRGWCSDTAK